MAYYSFEFIMSLAVDLMRNLELEPGLDRITIG